MSYDDATEPAESAESADDLEEPTEVQDESADEENGAAEV